MLSAVGHSLPCVCWMVVVASRFEASSLGCLTASGSFSLSLSLFPPSLLLFCSLRLLLFLLQFLATVASASLPLCTELYFLPWGKKSKEDWDCRGGREVWRRWEETREDGMDETLHSAADWRCPAEGKETFCLQVLWYSRAAAPLFSAEVKPGETEPTGVLGDLPHVGQHQVLVCTGQRSAPAREDGRFPVPMELDVNWRRCLLCQSGSGGLHAVFHLYSHVGFLCISAAARDDYTHILI